ncbi:hypothetical protein KMP13_17005 [Epibacterium ulvae]|uniref:hypothetical protein n=1 Tax=Epibacterium ulvae TaxID=1156985 RepID=UPI001BFC69DE|nr:hypothetical protein [Epibacterium ulvae]MBT8155533.1 hypothetical protein [Epibacterium ulvae]
MDHEIWRCLPGACGVEDVSSVLNQLLVRWDNGLAEDLFWEKLYHRETLYPVIFAALPRLWNMSETDAQARDRILPCLSHVIYCAFAEYGAGRIMLDTASDAIDASDGAQWNALKDWLLATVPAINTACLAAVIA